MEILTKYHGKIDLNQHDVLQFPTGIPGFGDEQEFTLLPFSEETPFQIMQSIKTPALAFVTVSPFLFFNNYEFEMTLPVQEQLRLEKFEDVDVLVIITVKDPFHESTANLQAPIVVNRNGKLAKQVVLNDKRYQTKHRLIPEMQDSQEG